MRTITTSLGLFALMTLSACGISDGTELSSLEGEDLVQICEDNAAEDRTISCDDGAGGTIEIELSSDCSTAGDSTFPEACTATVGDYKDCQSALANASDEDLCAGTLPSECDALFADACVGGEDTDDTDDTDA